MDMDALKEASRKVAAVKNRGPRASNGDIMANGVVDQWLQQKRIRQQPMDQWNRRRRKFMILEKIDQRCEVYRANLLPVLRDVEEQKLNLSVMVQNGRSTNPPLTDIIRFGPLHIAVSLTIFKHVY